MHTHNGKIKHYPIQTIIFIITGLFFALYAHDSNLYPHLSTIDTAILSFLRFFLLATPVFLGFLIVQFKQRNFLKYLLLVVWILFLPYTIYSITEIRHIAELCRLPELNTYYTEICVTKLWMLFQTFIYSAAGSLGFVFSVSQVTSHLFLVSWKKQTTIISMCFLSGFASVFGLYTRINIWEIFSNPIMFFQSISTTTYQKDFLWNVSVFSLFVIGYFFVTNRLFRQANKSRT